MGPGSALIVKEYMNLLKSATEFIETNLAVVAAEEALGRDYVSRLADLSQLVRQFEVDLREDICVFQEDDCEFWFKVNLAEKGLAVVARAFRDADWRAIRDAGRRDRRHDPMPTDDRPAT